MSPESPTRIEPCLFEDSVPSALSYLAFDIERVAAALGRGLHPDAIAELAAMTRIMNSYYSNLIEGHHTRPRDIQRAMDDPSKLSEKDRPNALVALAHVVVQRQVDHLASTGRLPSPASAGFLLWLHREFYRATPDQFRFLTRNDGSRAEVVPGQFRVRPEEDNEVGAHLPPSSGRVQAFMAYFEKRYAMAERRPGALILAMPAAHHRFAFVHPFVDGNGRVGRLMSHAMALKAGIGAGGLWSISRGLARGLKERCEYKRMLAHADTPRQGDRDGRGNLSMKALEEFSEWFLQVCLDQIRFCSTMYDFPGLQDRYHRLIDDMMGTSGRHAKKLISSVLRHGELQRMEAGNVTGTSERTGRYALAEAVQMGFLKSGSVRGPVRVAFPLDYRERLFPNLFTDHEIEIPPAAGTQGG